MFEFKLPDIGEGVVEGEVVRWLVEVGELVREDQPIVEVMTDKATVEITSPRVGSIARIHFRDGEVCPVGGVLVEIDTGSITSGEVPAEAAPAVVAAPPAPSAVDRAGRNGGPSPASAARVLATPAVRKRAREMGLSIAEVSGTGPRGRITRDDLDRQVAGLAAPATASPGSGPASPVGPSDFPDGAEERIPLRGVRRKIADAMVRSITTAAHFTYVEEIDMTEVVRHRQRSKVHAAERGVKLTYLPYIIKAVIRGLRDHPLMNASLDDAASEIVVRRDIHIGVACHTPGGLMVPVVRHADRKSILEIAGEIVDLATRCREGRARSEELRGSTFTLTSTGNVGGVLATPIINHPEVAILGAHVIRDRAMVIEGEIVIRKMMNVSVSFDHRVIDGQSGAEFTNVVKRTLESPELLLLEAR